MHIRVSCTQHFLSECDVLLVHSVGYLHELRDTVLAKQAGNTLTKVLGETLTEKLGGKKEHGLNVQADLSQVSEHPQVVADCSVQFASIYEQSVLELEALTPHQEEKLKECEIRKAVLVEVI